MRTISDTLKPIIAGSAAIPRTLYHLEVVDKGIPPYEDQEGQIHHLYLTNHEEDLEFGGITYESYKIKHSDIKTYKENQVDNCDITIDNVDRGFSSFFHYNEFSGQHAEIWKIFLNPATLQPIGTFAGGDYIRQFSGLMDRPKVSEETCQIRVVNVFNREQSYTPWRRFMAKCNWDFCWTECGYNGGNGKQRGTADGGTTTTLVDAAIASTVTDYWKGASLKILSGANKGEEKKISAYDPSTKTLTVEGSFSQAIDSSSKYIIECDKAKSTCNTFGNTPQFGGFSGMRTSENGDLPKGKDGTKWGASTPVYGDESFIPLVYGYGQVDGQLLDAQLETPHYIPNGLRDTRLYAIAAGTLTSVVECRVNGNSIDIRQATYPISWRFFDGTQTTNIGLEETNYYKTTAVARMDGAYDAGKQYPKMWDISLHFKDSVKFTVKGLKVQKYLASGTPDGSPVWSNNPVWCLLDFLINRSSKPIRSLDGINTDLTKYIDFAAAYNAAAVCDANGYKLNLVIREQKKDPEIIDLMLAAFRGYITYSSGKMAINAETVYGDPAYSFDDATSGKTLDNICEGSFNYYQKDVNDVPNKVIVKYIDQEERQNMALVNDVLTYGAATVSFSDTKGTLATGEFYIAGYKVNGTLSGNSFVSCTWETPTPNPVPQFSSGYPLFQGLQTFPERTAIFNDYDNQDRVKRVIEKEIDGSTIPTYRQAYNIAEYWGKKLVQGNLYCNLKGMMDSLNLEVGDVVKVTHALPGWVDAQFRITEASESEDEEVEYTAEFYDPSFLSENDHLPPVALATTLPNPFAVPGHVTGVSISEDGYTNIDGTYTPVITVVYTLPSGDSAIFWDRAKIQVSTDSWATYPPIEMIDRTRGAGFKIDGTTGGFKVGQTVYVKVISISSRNIMADATTAPTASRKIHDLITVPMVPSGLRLEGGASPVDYTWDGLKFTAVWIAPGGGGLELSGQDVMGAGGVQVDPNWLYDEMELWVGGEKVFSKRDKDCRYEYVYGDGKDAYIDAPLIAAHGAATIKVRRWNRFNKFSDYNEITIMQKAPANPTNLTADFTGKDLVLAWDKAAETDFAYYSLTLNGNEKKLTDPFYTYSFEENVKDNTNPDPSITYSLKVYDVFGNSSAALAGTFTNSIPVASPAISVRQWMDSVQFEWTRSPEPDISHYIYRHQVAAGGWFQWTSTIGNSVMLFAEAGQAISIEVKSVDFFGQELQAPATASGTAQGLNIQPSDINDFAVTASKIFTKIPILQGDSWSDNFPAAGRTAWNAHTIYYNGAEYSITPGDTDLKYIFWTGGTAYQASNTNPVLTDGQFIIATNVNGYHDLAWNAVANEVIGSAYIQALAVQDAHISNLNVSKLLAGTITSKSIELAVADGSGDTVIRAGKTDFGDDNTNGFILGVDDSDPNNKAKFEIGDANNYLKWSGSTLNIKGRLEGDTYNYWDLTTGNFRAGDANKYIQWNGSTLTIRGSLNADDITVGTLTGRTIQTASNGKRFVVDTSSNEAHFYGDRGDGTVEELAFIGVGNSDFGFTIGHFGAPDCSRIGVMGRSSSNYGIYGTSATGVGVYGTGVNGVAGSGTSDGVIGTSTGEWASGVYGANSGGGSGFFIGVKGYSDKDQAGSGTRVGVYGHGDRGAASYGGYFYSRASIVNNQPGGNIVLPISDWGGAPTQSAIAGTLFMSHDATLYVNKDGSTTWQTVGDLVPGATVDITSTQSYTHPTNSKALLVELFGGGGAGKTGDQGGGGGGGYVRILLSTKGLDASNTVTIGAGSSKITGSDGGDTSFGTLAKALGGKGVVNGGTGGRWDNPALSSLIISFFPAGGGSGRPPGSSGGGGGGGGYDGGPVNGGAGGYGGGNGGNHDGDGSGYGGGGGTNGNGAAGGCKITPYI